MITWEDIRHEHFQQVKVFITNVIFHDPMNFEVRQMKSLWMKYFTLVKKIYRFVIVHEDEQRATTYI